VHAAYTKADISTKQKMVAINPNFEIVPIFLKNFFLLMLNPDGKTISGRMKLKKKVGLKINAYCRNSFDSGNSSSSFGDSPMTNLLNFEICQTTYDSPIPSITMTAEVWPNLGLYFSKSDSITKNMERKNKIKMKYQPSILALCSSLSTAVGIFYFFKKKYIF